MKRLPALVLLVLGAAAALAPWTATNDPRTQHRDRAYAPPMPLRVVDDQGRLRRPFVYPLRLLDRLERRFEEDRSRPVRVVWFSNGRLARLADEGEGPWLPLGADSLGRDTLSRLVWGARVSLSLALLAAAGALLLGVLVGALAGVAGGFVDEGLMRVADFVLVLPALYVVLTLRASLPLSMPAVQVFLLTAAVLALVGWPFVARGVRAIIRSEAATDYAAAARAAGATPTRLLVKHLFPAATGFIRTQFVLLLPAFIVAEATLSYVGLGFGPAIATWGTMLQEAANVSVLAGRPWLLSPAAAIVIVVLCLNVLLGRRATARATVRT